MTTIEGAWQAFLAAVAEAQELHASGAGAEVLQDVLQHARELPVIDDEIAANQLDMPDDARNARPKAPQADSRARVIAVERATAELYSAITGLFPEHWSAEWRRDTVILIDTTIRVDSERPNQRAREIALRFGERAMKQYGAADADTRKRRCLLLQTLIRTRMTGYDPAEDARKGEAAPQLVIKCGEAIGD